MKLKDVDGKKIKIACDVYTFSIKKNISKDGVDYYGHTDNENRLIEIAYGSGEKQAFLTIFHEILHALWYVQGLSYALDADEAEEFLVNSITNNLGGIIQDNPWVAKIFQEI